MTLFSTSFRLLLPALACLSLIVGCSDRSTTSNDNILRLGNGGEPPDIDPHTVAGNPEVRIISSLFEGLVTYHPENDDIPYPGVAREWSMSADGRSWDFFLREDARWSNGDPVTAADFVFSWKRVLTASLGNDYVDWFYMIAGAEDYHLGRIEDFAQVGVEAIDPHHLRIRLREPVADFLKILLNHSFLPVHPPTVTASGGDKRRASGWTQPATIVGNGAFVLKEWIPNSVIRVSRNPHYWDRQTVQLDGIEFIPIADENTEYRAFRSGQLHVTQSAPVNLRARYRERNPDQIRFDPFAAVYYYSFNTTRAPFDDPRVRHALSLAIDREQIVRRLLEGGERAATGIIPDGIGGYASPGRVLYDPQRARALLAAAGYPAGEGFPRAELLFNTSDNHRKLAEAVQSMWRGTLGIDVSLTNKEWKVYLDARQKLNFSVARAGWVGSLYSRSFLRNFQSHSPNNQTGWANPRYDELFREAEITIDPARHLELVRAAEDILMEELPLTPLYWYTNVYFIHPRVENWHPKLIDQRPFKHIRLRPAE